MRDEAKRRNAKRTADRGDEVVVEPPTKEAAQQRGARRPGSPEELARKLEGHLGDANWGDAASGGSVIDKRRPKR